MVRYRKYRNLLLLSTFIACTGCEKYIQYVNAPEFEQKLVIASFISPEDTISDIFVSSNQPLYSYVDEEFSAGDLSGLISDGENETALEQRGRGLFFRQNQMKIIPGKQYTLKVYSSKGMYAEGSATVPEEKDLMIKIDTLTVLHDDVPGYTYTEFRISTSFSDDPAEKNFYSITGRFIGYKTNSNLKVDRYSERMWYEESYLKDTKANAENRIKLDSWISRSYHYYDSAFISVYVMNTEESYYLYHKSLDDSGYGDNMFTEAKPLYSNIKGGLGIFTSYTLDSLRLRLK